LAKYRMILALLAGAGFTALITELLNVPFFPGPILLSIILMPGGLLASLFSGSDGFGPPLAVMAANALVYSMIAYAAFTWSLREAAVRRMKSATLIFTAPALVLSCLACVPSLNPLWPRGMAHLAEEEKSLREGLPVGSGLDHSRAFLQARGIKPYVEKKSLQPVTLQRGPTKIVAQPGDQLISARIPTEAGQFPCGYAIEVLLIFDTNEKLEQSHIDSLRICP